MNINYFFLIEQTMEQEILSTFLTLDTSEIVDFVRKYHFIYCASIQSLCTQRLPCFWSCKNGGEYAKKNVNYFTDSDCPIISLLFNTKPLKEISYEISKAYASLASKEVMVYIGSDKSNEEIGFHLGNNFWNAEFPVLRNLMYQGIVSDIIINLIQNNIIIKKLSVKQNKITLPLWRRSWHPSDGIQRRLSFVWPAMTDKDWDVWRKASPRPFIRYNIIIKIVKIWKSKISI